METNKGKNKEWRKFMRKEALLPMMDKPTDINEELSPEERIAKIMRERKINSTKTYKQQPSLVTIKNENGGESTIFSSENISTIIGKAKSKKSFFTAMLVAAAAGGNTIDNTITGALPSNKNKVVLIDTEQAEYNVAKSTDRIKNMIPSDKIKNLEVYNMRGLEIEDMVNVLFTVANDEEVGLIFIDQIADFLKSINSEDEAIALIRVLEKLTKDKGIHICVVLHQNRNTEYGNGWIGSTLEKKSETVIKVEKSPEENASSIIPYMCRNREFREFDIIIDDNGQPRVNDGAFAANNLVQNLKQIN